MKDSRNPIRIAPVKQEEERPVLPFHSLEMAAPMNNEAKYQALFQYMPIGFAFNEIITDDEGSPVDYIFLEMNDEFTRMTGISPEHALGKKVTEVEPRILNQEEDWIERYGEVALRGKTFHLERYSETYGRWYRQTAYSPERGTFVSLLMDITEQKQLQHKLEELVEGEKAPCKGDEPPDKEQSPYGLVPYSPERDWARKGKNRPLRFGKPSRGGPFTP